MPFQRLFAIFPIGVGLTLLGFLWLQPFGGFGSPPLFFRIFGSFVALFFVLVGAAIFSAKAPRQIHEAASRLADSSPPQPPHPEASGFQCRHCGAPLGEGADVSPHGDVKCGHCNRWFNIHQDV